MKKIAILLVAMSLVFASVPAVFAVEEYKENALDKTWDWATTLGKSGLEKDQILAKNKAERMQRYAERVAKQAQKDADKAAKQAQKDLSKTGKDMKKNLGF